MGIYFVCYSTADAISGLVKFFLCLNLLKKSISYVLQNKRSCHKSVLGVGGDLSPPCVLPNHRPHSEF